LNNELLKPTLAEFLGTFTLVFIGGAAVASGQPVVVPALAHGLILAGLIYIYGDISGAQFNPAVTAGLLIGGKVGVTRAIAYWIAQFVGGIVAAFLLAAITQGNNAGATTGSLTQSAVWNAAAFEFFLVFFLVSAVYQAAIYGKAGQLAGLAISLTLAACILAAGTYTGASVNPARTLGPALVAGDLSYVVPYFIGMFAGGIAAGLVQTNLFAPASTR
jgi:glycerol uptake facilitator-like aquaporin